MIAFTEVGEGETIFPAVNQIQFWRADVKNCDRIFHQFNTF